MGQSTQTVTLILMLIQAVEITGESLISVFLHFVGLPTGERNNLLAACELSAKNHSFPTETIENVSFEYSKDG